LPVEPLVGLGEPQAEVDEVGVDDFLGVIAPG
jgi:hypothetical protein